MSMRAYTNRTRDEMVAAGFGPNFPRDNMTIIVGGQQVSIGYDRATNRFYLEILGHSDPWLGLSPVAQAVISRMGKVTYSRYTVANRGRRPGEYRYRTANLIASSPNAGAYAITGEDPNDVMELERLLAAGLIVPELPYDREQVKALPTEFRQVWREFWALVKRQLAEWRFRIDRFANTPQ